MMPRTILSKVPVALSAHETWRLRCDFEVERYIATHGNRKLTLVSENSSGPGTDWEQCQRQVRCELLGDQIGGSVMGVRTSDLASDVTSHFYVHQFGEEHGAEFWVSMLLKKVKVTLEGRQWIVPASNVSCYLCTRVQVDVRIVGIGSLVEMQLDRHIRASHAAFPQHALNFLAAQRAEARPASPPPQPDPPPPDPPPPSLESSEMDAAVIVPQGSNRCLFFGGLLFGTVLRRARRHRILESKHWNASSTVPVRIGRQHARVLLLFGCASPVVDSDEIVE